METTRTLFASGMRSRRARGLRDGVLTEIGRRGERLTLQYEQSRTGVEPKWIALESSAHGSAI